MKYLMLVCVDPDFKPGQEEGAPDIEQWVAENDAAGVRLIGNRLRPGLQHRSQARLRE